MDPQRKISGIIFDLDGTLLDTLPDLAQSVNFCRAHFGLPPISDGSIRSYIGDGVRKLLERAFVRTGVSVEAAYEIMVPYYRDHLFEGTRVYDGVAETLGQISLPLAVVTNKLSEYIRPLLKHYGLDRHFRMTIGGDTLPHKKPDPRALRVVSGKLGVPQGQWIVVGDGPADLEFARNGGVPSVYCAYGYGDPGAFPYEWKISKFNELLQILR